MLHNLDSQEWLSYKGRCILPLKLGTNVRFEYRERVRNAKSFGGDSAWAAHGIEFFGRHLRSGQKIGPTSKKREFQQAE